MSSSSLELAASIVDNVAIGIWGALSSQIGQSVNRDNSIKFVCEILDRQTLSIEKAQKALDERRNKLLHRLSETLEDINHSENCSFFTGDPVGPIECDCNLRKAQSIVLTLKDLN